MKEGLAIEIQEIEDLDWMMELETTWLGRLIGKTHSMDEDYALSWSYLCAAVIMQRT